MDQPQYDEAAWPTLLITMPKRELDDAELCAHLDKLSSFSKRGQPFVTVIDVRAASSLSAHARRVVAERMDKDEEAYPGALLGIAIVLSTPLHRGIFKAISWLTRSQRPYEAFSRLEDARLWARQLVRTPSIVPRPVRDSLPPVRSKTGP
jgi:hypothetical protein